MTRADFVALFPQFADFRPALALDSYLSLANARFSDFDADVEMARALFTAHYLTLYARAIPASSADETQQAIAAVGDQTKQIASKKVGEVSVSYGTSSSSSASVKETAFADLTETLFGRQLLTLIRLHSMTKYVP